MSHYHNSTGQDEAFVEKAEAKSKSQDAEVLEIMQELVQATASEVWKLMPNYDKIPITNVRRSLSNYCKGDNLDAKLMKADKKKIGIYGRPEHYYTLINSQTKMF